MHGPRCDDHQPSHRRPDLRAVRRCLVTLGAALLLLFVALAATAPEAMARPRGERPVAFKIPALGVEAPMEVLTTVRGQMQDPTTAEVVSWYDDSARLGAPGNVVVAGHLELGGDPAVFARLHELKKGDLILLRGEDGTVYRYRVTGARVFGAEAGPWDALTGPTEQQTLTIITCAPPWDAAYGHYANRLVVRAVRVRR